MKWSRNRHQVIVKATAAGIAMALAIFANAAPPTGAANPDVSIDISAARADLINSTIVSGDAPHAYFASAAATPGQPFSGIATGIVSDNSNANQTTDGTSLNRIQLNPDLETDYRHSLSRMLQLLLSVDLNSNRYPDLSASSKDEVWLQAQFVHAPETPTFIGWNHYWYLTDRATEDFNTGFSGPQSKINDSFVGYTRQYYGTDNWGIATPANSTNLIGLDVNLGRRQASPSTGNGTYAKVKATFTHTINNQWSISLGTTAKYTERDTGGRRDSLINNMVLLKWTPVWMREMQCDCEVDFIDTYNVSRSTKSSADYNQNNAGPSVILRWKFM